MDRLARSLACCGLGFVLTASGCRMTRPEVPPGRPYSKDGRQRPAIGFSSEGHPVDGAATTNLMPDTAGASRLAEGIGSGATRPNMSTILGGASGSFGPPGTSGRGEQSSRANGTGPSSGPAPGDDAVLPAGAPTLPRQSIDPNPGSSSSANTLPPDAAPRPDQSHPSSQTVQPVMDAPGQMGRTGDFPSPM